MANPRIQGCSLFTTPAAGARRYPTAPFANSVFDATSAISTPLAGSNPFWDGIREIRVKNLIVQSVTTASTITITFEKADTSAAYAFVINSADLIAGTVITFPGDGLRFPHPIGLNKNSSTCVLSITYDVVN